MKKRKQIHIPIEDLKISTANMRKERKAPVVVDILPSIERLGVLVPLLVREEKSGWGIVAGRRRWHCLSLIAKANGDKLTAPCIVLEKDDDAAAIEASLLENIGRLPPTEMQQYEAFGRLESEGRSIDDIAHTFGITELAVRRVLALANLDSAIRKLYASDDIDRETAKALTLGSAEQQAEWLRLYRSDDERAPFGASCKRWIAGGERISTKHALFGVADYDGAVLEDLFGEDSIFADPAAFWCAQSHVIAARVGAYREAGWDVEVLERGYHFLIWDHVKRARTKGGRVYVEISHSGQVQFHEGYVTAAEDRKARKSDLETGEGPPAVRPEMSGPMADYIGLHRHSAACAELIKKPAIALRLIAAHLLAGSSLWAISEHHDGPIKQATASSLEHSKARQALSAHSDKAAELLKSYGLKHKPNGYSVSDCFAVCLRMNDDQLLEVTSDVMVKSLESRTSIVEAVLAVTDCNLSDYWTPDDAFFDILRDKRAINAMLAEIASPSTAKDMMAATTNAQKRAIINRRQGDGVKVPAPNWHPKWMMVPPQSYLPEAGNPIEAAWAKIAGLFGKQKKISAPVVSKTRSKKAA